ncbi:MAG: NTP transferase domain-containing protein [Clostridia bacterium]|nr:NTP transferase domain-containing protein [Clostridia bacterium]
MIGVILAAGDGTRLAMSTGQDICKALRKINDTHLIEFALDNLVELEINEVYIVVGKQGDSIKEVFGNQYKSLTVHYVHQYEQKGLVDAFVQALKEIKDNETVILQLSDEIFIDLNTEFIKNELKAENYDFYCGVTPEENEQKIKNNFSVETDSNSLLVKCTEKPKTVTDNVKGTGFSIFSGKTQKIIKETYESENNTLYDLCDCFNYLTEKGYRGLVFSVAEKEFNINTALDLTEVEKFLK